MKNKKQQLQKLKNERGLTLVELLAVIVILGIISTIAFVMIGNVMDNAKKDAHIANAQQLIASAKLFEASGNEIDSDGVTATKLHEEGLIEELVDPWDKSVLGEDKMKSSIVNKDDDGKYTVTLKANDSDHDIDEQSEENLRKGNRDEIFE